MFYEVGCKLVASLMFCRGRELGPRHVMNTKCGSMQDAWRERVFNKMSVVEHEVKP